jgi:hypothetical protein
MWDADAALTITFDARHDSGRFADANTGSRIQPTTASDGFKTADDHATNISHPLTWFLCPYCAPCTASSLSLLCGHGVAMSSNATHFLSGPEAHTTDSERASVCANTFEMSFDCFCLRLLFMPRWSQRYRPGDVRTVLCNESPSSGLCWWPSSARCFPPAAV